MQYNSYGTNFFKEFVLCCNFTNNFNVRRFAGNRAIEEGGGALGEKEPLEEHPGGVRPLFAGLVLPVLQSAAAQQNGVVFALGVINWQPTEFQCERLRTRVGASSNFVLDSVYFIFRWDLT